MADTTTIVLDADVAALVREIVLRGRHASANDAIRSALEEYRARDDAGYGLAGAEVERLWDEGLASGPAREADFDAVKREARRRATAGPLGG